MRVLHIENDRVHCHLPATGRRSLILVLIALAAAVPRLLLGASQFIEYDGYWHIFIAQQNKWANFREDIYNNAHPPLFFLLLKPVLHLGHSLLVYRSISILTGVASVWLVGWIAWKITHKELLAYEAALAYGLALPGIIMACEVRSYMLSVFFVLLSFDCLVDLAGTEQPKNQFGLRIRFAVWTILACLSHYFAFYYAGAAMVLLIVRRRISWKAEAATCAPIAAAVAALYFSHANRLAVIQSHLLPYYFDPKAQESATGFLLRNWRNFLNLFSPFEVSAAAAIGVLLVAAAASVWLARTLTIRITVIMLAGFALSALAGKYPFGGDLRQQYLLFPFLILCLAVVANQVACWFARLIPSWGRVAVNALLIAAIVWISAVRYREYPKVSQNVGLEQMQVFDRLEPAPQAVYLDQFNLILFYIYHHMWRWTSLDRQPVGGVDVYELRRGNDRMLVFRDKMDWNIDPTDPAVYNKLAQCARAENIPEISVFSARQSPPREPFTRLKTVRQTVVKDASDAALCVDKMAVNPVGWYTTLRFSGCKPTGVRPLQVTGTFENGSDEIDYEGGWLRGGFQAAASGTTSFTNVAGASATLSFEGTEITWVFAKAFNRGIAEVKIDGVPRGTVDLYSPKIVWQTHKTFGDLKPGKHTFEVIASGKKDAPATDRYVDIDELIVR